MEDGLGSSSDKAASMWEAQEGQCRFGMRNIVCSCVGEVMVAISLEAADAAGGDNIRAQTQSYRRLLVMIIYRLGDRRRY